MRRFFNWRYLAGIGSLMLLAVASLFPGSATAALPGQTRGWLPTNKIVLDSAIRVDLTHDFVRLPLHEGTANGTKVWYILTEASDFGLAHDLDVNFAPKLANMGIACAACVQNVTLNAPPVNAFGEARIQFEGAPDFSPDRVLVPGADSPFPPATAEPGSIGDPGYSPFIKIQGSQVVYNAPIVATGNGPFDVDTHSNTEDRVLAIHPAREVGDGQFSQPTVDLLLVHGFDAGQPILYISTESSDPVAATLERATFVPALADASFLGGDDFLGSARERIFPFVNGQNQGLDHLITAGHATEDASSQNRGLIEALRDGGDALNVQGDFPTQSDPRHANAYSPLWDAQIGEWTAKAIRLGLNTRQMDENQILNLAATRPDLLTGVGGAPYGASGFVINCPVIGFTDQRPVEDLVEPVPLAQA